MRWIKAAFKSSIFLLICGFLSLLIGAATITYSYDSAGRLVKANYGEGKTISYVYDPAGNLLSRMVYVPCFDWAAFTANLANWPNPETVLTLLDDIECPKNVKKAAPGS